MGIVIGIAVMILTLAITSGFQDEIRAKVIGSGSHIQLSSVTQTNPRETPRLHITQSKRDSLLAIDGVRHLQSYATRAGILETKDEIEGILVKGVGADYDWSFMQRNLVSGETLTIQDETKNEVLISSWHANRLRIGVDSTITIYLIKGEDVRPRKYSVKGIYATGMEQVDHELVLIDIAHLQRFARWGLSAQVLVEDSCNEESTWLTGRAFGGSRPHYFDWPNTSLVGKGPHPVCVKKDSTITMVLTDAALTISDTAFIEFDLNDDDFNEACACSKNAQITVTTTGGSSKYYAGGYELAINDFERIQELDIEVYRALDIGLRTQSITERFPEIFSWLELLDTNVLVVIVLMIAVAIINMTSALLIIILEKTSMIGILKSLGAHNNSIRRIFLIDAGYIMGIGIVLGNILGVGLALIQQKWGVVSLPAESYYVNTVPIRLDWANILLLDLGTMLVCLLALVLPTVLVTRIAPAKAIKVLD